MTDGSRVEAGVRIGLRGTREHGTCSMTDDAKSSNHKRFESGRPFVARCPATPGRPVEKDKRIATSWCDRLTAGMR